MKVIVDNLVKSYAKGSPRAVDGVSFSVGAGEIFGLIGPDGAGKTSIFRMLATLLIPDSGRATVMGYDSVNDYRKIRSLLGYMPGRFSLYQDLTVEENLRFFATVFNTSIEENYELIRDIYILLEPFKHRRAGKLSGGMKQKLALCCALIHKPEVLLLDEPTTGVDPVSRNEFWEMLDKLKSYGIATLVSTPYMDEAVLCDRIGLIQHGRLLGINTPAAVMASFPRALYAIRSRNMTGLLRDLKTIPVVRTALAFGSSIHFTLRSEGEEDAASIPGVLSRQGHEEIRMEKIDPSIEDCFIEILAG